MISAIQWFGLIVLLLGAIYLAAQVDRLNTQLSRMNRMVVNQGRQIHLLQKRVDLSGVDDAQIDPMHKGRRRPHGSGNRNSTSGPAPAGGEDMNAPRLDSRSIRREQEVAQTASKEIQKKRVAQSSESRVKQMKSGSVPGKGMNQRQRTPVLPGYAVLAGQYTVRSEAVRVQQRLLARGYPARVSQASGRWLVSVGRFDHPSSAQHYIDALQRAEPHGNFSVIPSGK